MVAGDQRLVPSPFGPSGYWSPGAPLVWSQGFPTPLGGLSMSINPVKAPDIRFASSQFRKQHAGHEKAVCMTSLAEAIYTWLCCCVFFCYSCSVCLMYRDYGECCCAPLIVPASEFVLGTQHRARQRIKIIDINLSSYNNDKKNYPTRL
ncbi:unnamed protein product [Schistosoma mattheei]|uniref:Uncharacterized protein n=2 Tax=Schistosoma TaxID=6181 RepID=A0A183PHM5_9TREM|nr:unnamed protein product [Schistosoma mattheei]